ncbi:hypothetical protein M0R45_032049 [Rubus argutus]|uniref:Uncharacterized protein n=1 Tax=Rubus argutus TaxID=59490 RepID=A0AAW1WJY3_RUBAR
MPSWPIDRYDHLPESFVDCFVLLVFPVHVVRIASLKLFNLTELNSNFKRSSLALQLAQPTFKSGLAYALSFWPQCLCPAPSTVKGGSVHEVLGFTAAQADVQVTFEISDLRKQMCWTQVGLIHIICGAMRLPQLKVWVRT